ncbi:hypothetical protein D7X32_22285 [Corallococcus carmarthensis]|uniref:Uncharacterized protein n=2 Tax=Corallococcus carmarthensis TaxID=2316728 RepID=A0A3A8K9I1_9BACT|nr:hypothetical protein D7X32_22285 [Corallococcus carmarthensis]
MKVASPPLVVRAAMVVSALVWVYQLFILLPSPLSWYLADLLRGMLHGFALGVIGLGVVSLFSRRETLLRWRWTWGGWFIVAVGWFPITMLVSAVIGYSPVFLVLWGVGLPLLLLAERRAPAR